MRIKRALNSLILILGFGCFFNYGWAIGPQRRAVDAGQWSDQACDQFIAQNSTLYLNEEPSKQTLTATNTLSAWTSRYGTISFTQATGANQPTRTRADQRENRVVYSEDINTGSTWATVRATKLGTNEFKEDGTAGNTHYIIQQTIQTVSGSPYYVSASFKRGTGTRNVRLYITFTGSGGNITAGLNLGTCALNDTTGTTVAWTSGPTVSADPVDGTYCKVSGIVTSNSTGNTNLLPYIVDGSYNVTFNGDNASSIFVTRAQLSSTSAAPHYEATTAYPLYRGSAGRAGVRFDGSNDTMASTATLAGVFGASAKSFFAVVRPNAFAADAEIFYDSGPAWFFRTIATGFRFANYDAGGADNLDIAASAIQPYVILYTHDGTNQYAWTNGAASAAVATGATTPTNGTWAVGGATSDLNGILFALGASNKVWSPQTRKRIETCLCRRYGANCQ